MCKNFCKKNNNSKIRKCCDLTKTSLKTISTGGHKHGLYFEKNQQHLTVVSGIVTIFGAIAVIAASIKILIDIQRHTHTETKIDYPHFQLRTYNKTLNQFLDESALGFEIKAMSYEAMLPTTLDCSNFIFALEYVLTLDDVNPLNLNVNCTEKNGNLFYDVVQNETLDSYIIMNDEFYRLQITYKGEDFAINGTRLYFLYQGLNNFYTGSDIQSTNFTSLDLELGTFYKTQISPLIYQTMPNPWQMDIFGLEYKDDLLFQYSEPYFQSSIPSYGGKQMLIYFKYNNDNNPFTKVTVNPNTLLTGLEKIGGQMKIIGICSVFLFIYNKWKFEKKLKKKYAEIIKQKEGIDKEIDDNTMKDFSSYEIMMELVYEHLKAKRNESYQATNNNVFDESQVMNTQKEELEEDSDKKDESEDKHDDGDYQKESNIEFDEPSNDDNDNEKQKQ